MVFQTMKERERKDLAAAKFSTDSASTQPQPFLQLMWSSFRGTYDFKEVMTTGLSDNV